MPTLDPDPETSVTTNTDDKTKAEVKPQDGENGKIVLKPENNEESEQAAEPNNDNSEVKEQKLENVISGNHEPRWVETADGQIEVEDPDDYLMYLEDILNRIHRSVIKYL